MRYAVLSDIHANLEAFEAVLESLKGEGIDAYMSLGDVVGYGADPSACIELLRSLKPEASIAGNHDRGVAGSFPLDDFNEWARQAALWTRDAIDRDDADYLRSLPAIYKAPGFILAHGSLEHPEKFNYILSGLDAARSMALMDRPVLFVGHSHVPRVYGPGKSGRSIVNAGSIGQPRDSDPRASFVIYDSGSSEAEIVRVDYDIEKARRKIIDAGLPPFLGDRLRKGQ